MPVFNASDQAVNTVAGTTITASSAAAAAGANRFLEVFLLTGAGSPEVHSGVTWGGEALTQRGSSLDVGSFWRMSRWFIKEADFPSGATGDIVGTFAGDQDEKVLLWMVHENVNQTSPYRNASQTTATGTDNSPTVTVTSDSGDVVTACAWAGRTSAVITGIAVDSGASREEVDAVAGGFECAGMGTIAGAASSVVQSWDVTTGDTIDWGMLGDSLQDEPAGPSAAITGTATAAIDEDDVVAGGKTIIITLTDDTWVASGGTFDGIRQDIIDGLDSAQSEGTGWNAEVRDKQGVSGVVRTSDTVVTITLDAQAAYDITAQETITVTVPATALTGAAPLTGSPTFTVDFVPAAGQTYNVSPLFM